MTEAERERARMLLAPFIFLERTGPMEAREFRQAAEAISSALAAARAQGWREGIEAAAAKYVEDWDNESMTQDDMVAAIRNLKQPQEPPHAP